jgi:hypothetical protein
MRVGGQLLTPTALPPGKRPGTHFIGGWVGPRAGLDGCGKSRPYRDSIPGLDYGLCPVGNLLLGGWMFGQLATFATSCTEPEAETFTENSVRKKGKPFPTLHVVILPSLYVTYESNRYRGTISVCPAFFVPACFKSKIAGQSLINFVWTLWYWRPQNCR